jgi:hypothetical protein
MGSIIYLHRVRPTHALLCAARDIAEARLEAALIPELGGVGRNDTIGLLQQECWRLVMWAKPRHYAECLRTLRYIGHQFLITDANLLTLLLCLQIKDNEYRDAVA